MLTDSLPLLINMMLKLFYGKHSKTGELINLAANRTGCIEVVDWALTVLNPTEEQKAKLSAMREALLRERRETMSKLNDLLIEMNIRPEELNLGEK